MNFTKSIKVTNEKNVLVQVPKAVVCEWGVRAGDMLEVSFDGEKVTIKPNVRHRGGAAESC